MRRAAGVAAAAAVVLSACQAADSEETASADSDAPSTSLELGPFEDVPSAIDDPEADGLPEPLVEADRLVSGGPPPDGIPSLDDPRFEEPAEVDWLEDPEPVLAVEVEGERLPAVDHLDTFWFAWVAFIPDTEILE